MKTRAALATLPLAILLALPAGAEVSDRLLIHSDDADGSQVFTDASPRRHPITPYGDVAHSTDESAPGLGMSAIFFDGDGDFLKLEPDPDWSLGGDFEIELWAWFASFTRELVLASGSRSFWLNGHGWSLVAWSSAVAFGYQQPSPNRWDLDLYGSYPFQLRTWYHLKVARQNGFIRILVNGQEVPLRDGTEAGSPLVGTSFLYPATIRSDFPLYVGACTGEGSGLVHKGFLDEIRIAHGTTYTEVSLTGCDSAAAEDSDNDGVIDPWDDCPDTPPDSWVDRHGCPPGCP
ncbi:MAG: hypothetical protein AB1634_13030 [Thermodesulfobacteriota bacterium]